MGETRHFAGVAVVLVGHNGRKYAPRTGKQQEIPVIRLIVSLASVVAATVVLTACSEAPVETEEVAVPLSPPTYSAAAFYNSVSVSLAGDHAWSADNSKLLIQSDVTGIFNAYALDVATSQLEPLTQSTDQTMRVASWFPTDDRAIVVADQGGDELNHVYVRELDGTLTDLTPGQGHRAMFAGFLDDGSAFSVASNERNPQFFDLYAYDTSDYSRELIFQNDAGFMVAAGTDDGLLALIKANSSADSDIFLVDLNEPDAEPELITPHEGNISYGVFDFTRDGSKLIFATNEHGEFREAWSYDVETGEKAPYVAADWDIAFLGFSRSGRYRIVGTNEDARIKVDITDLETGEPVALPDLPDGAFGQVRFSRDESQMAFMLFSDTSPADIYHVDLAAGTVKRHTQTLNTAIDEDRLVASEVVRYPSYDGLEIPSILYRPKDASAENPVPALVWVHGGPGGQSTTGYNPLVQHLVNHGYAILMANNRGSSGYGKTFFHMDDRKHGDVDLKDIVEGRTYLESLDWVDGDRIGIIGGSYGGYMVGAALAFEPGVFDVGINIFGVMNWVRTLSNIPPWWGANKDALYDEMGDPAMDAERHRAISPLFHAENIKVPLLVVQGANDPRVLQVESDEIVAAVRANDVPVEYVLFDDEGHGFTKRVNRITASEAYVGFLDEHL